MFECRCPKCNKMLGEVISGRITIASSTDMLDYRPEVSDVVLEILCTRCKKYVLVYAKGGVEIEHGDVRRD